MEVPEKGRVGARRFALLALAASCGCALLAAPGPVPAPKAHALPPADTPVRVALLWTDAVDLDLYVTDPALETVYFANNPSGSGGRLRSDVSCRSLERDVEASAPAEMVTWEHPAAGRYRVGVDYIDRCGRGGDEARFRLVVDARGETIERSGAVRFERFDPVVLEFDLPEETGRQSRQTPPEEENAP